MYHHLFKLGYMEIFTSEITCVGKIAHFYILQCLYLEETYQ